jgi:adenosylcobinamide-GDP ribazoletransferase
VNRQFSLIATAITFYTRIPLPGEMHSGEQQLNEATQWLPLMGVIVGAIAAALYAAIAVTVGTAVAAVGAMATGIALTGAFHEDGLADTADGVGGGWTVEQKLEIIKDSRVGSYGLITTVLVQLAVFASLVELYAAAGSVGVVVRALIVAHVVSRLAPVLVIAHGTYARADATSKVRPVSKGI